MTIWRKSWWETKPNKNEYETVTVNNNESLNLISSVVEDGACILMYLINQSRIFMLILSMLLKMRTVKVIF